MKGRRIAGIVAVGVIGLGLPFVTPAHARGTSVRASDVTRALHQAPDGKEIYLKHCKECHGVIGVPTKASQRKYDKIPSFADPEFFKSKKDAELLKSVTEGKGRDMKGFSEKLSKDEIKAVVEYIHTLEKKG